MSEDTACLQSIQKEIQKESRTLAQVVTQLSTLEKAQEELKISHKEFRQYLDVYFVRLTRYRPVELLTYLVAGGAISTIGQILLTHTPS